MKIVVGSDHGGFDLKEELRRRLTEEGHEVTDVGCHGERVDYPDIARDLCAVVNGGGVDFGILCCGTGIGISMAANKVPGIRAAVCSEPYSARMARMHNDANIIAFGARVVGSEMARMIVDEFMAAQYEGGRHAARVALLTQLEEKYAKK